MFILQEIQTNGETTALLPAIRGETRQEIESIFYQKCAYAVTSAVEIHTIMVYTHEGFVVPDLVKVFKHYNENVGS